MFLCYFLIEKNPGIFQTLGSNHYSEPTASPSTERKSQGFLNFTPVLTISEGLNFSTYTHVWKNRNCFLHTHNGTLKLSVVNVSAGFHGICQSSVCLLLSFMSINPIIFDT
jgi:hypothetical protein